MEAEGGVENVDKCDTFYVCYACKIVQYIKHNIQ
jgi:hypothetical protein